MKIEELKVGDRIKYYYPEFMIHDKTIGEGVIEYICEHNVVINGAAINKSAIISKLEALTPQYKEIKIEQNSLSNLHPYVCPVCDKSYGITGVIIPQQKEICKECLDEIMKKFKFDDPDYDSGKPVKKSYKFDLEFVREIELIQDPLRPGCCPNASFRIEGVRIINYPNKILEKLNGKAVTIEITEKE